MILGMKATTFYKKQANGHDDKTSETEAFESIRCCSLAAQWHSHLWLNITGTFTPLVRIEETIVPD